MKLLHLSDLHIGRLLFEYSLIDVQRHWCAQVVDFLKQNPHEAVLLAGDLYDRAVPAADAVELLDSFVTTLVTELGLPVLAVSGNHDSGRRLAFGSSLYSGSGFHMAAVPQADVQRVTLTDEHGPVDVWLLPYITPADARNCFPGCEAKTYHQAHAAFVEAIHTAMDATRRNLLVAHGFYAMLGDPAAQAPVTSDSEVTIGGLDLTDAALFRGFDYCAFGHLHAPQRVGGGAMCYSGSPLCYSVAEQRQPKGLLSVTLGPKDTPITVETTTLEPLRRVYSVTGTLEELCAPTGGEWASDDYVYVNLITQGSEPAVAQRVRNLYPNYLGISYRSTAEAQVTLGGGGEARQRTLPEAFAGFFADVTGRELTPMEQTAVQEAAQATREVEE